MMPLRTQNLTILLSVTDTRTDTAAYRDAMDASKKALSIGIVTRIFFPFSLGYRVALYQKESMGMVEGPSKAFNKVSMTDALTKEDYLWPFILP